MFVTCGIIFRFAIVHWSGEWGLGKTRKGCTDWTQVENHCSGKTHTLAQTSVLRTMVITYENILLVLIIASPIRILSVLITYKTYFHLWKVSATVHRWSTGRQLLWQYFSVFQSGPAHWPKHFSTCCLLRYLRRLSPKMKKRFSLQTFSNFANC